MSETSPLETRYPQLHFLLQCLDEGNEEEPADQTQFGELDGDLIYVYGIADGALYHLLKPWLGEKEERLLVFLEENSRPLRALNDSQLALDPQVHIRFKLPSATWEAFVEELAKEFPVTNLHLLQGKKGSVPEVLTLRLKRRTLLAHAHLNEALFYHRLFENLLPNFFKWEGAACVNAMKGAFANTPALICGAGPSLDDHIGAIKELKGSALVMGGGSAITALTRAGVIPHLGIAIDPNIDELTNLSKAEPGAMPLLFASRVRSEIFDHFKGPLGVMHTGTGGAIEQWLWHTLGLCDQLIAEKVGDEGLSVTTASIALAHFFGCNPIYLAGVDLAYIDNKQYAGDVLGETAPQGIEHDGRRTEVHWIMESEWIGQFIKDHPQTQFHTLPSKGLIIPNINQATSLDLPPIPNLTEQVAQAFNAHKLTSLNLREPLHELFESFKRVESIYRKLWDNPELDCLYELDLQEELAFKLAVGPFVNKLKTLANKGRRSGDKILQESIAQFLKSAITACNNYLLC